MHSRSLTASKLFFGISTAVSFLPAATNWFGSRGYFIPYSVNSFGFLSIAELLIIATTTFKIISSLLLLTVYKLRVGSVTSGILLPVYPKRNSLLQIQYQSFN